MQDKQPSLRLRLAKIILGGKAKDFIAPLSPDGGAWGPDLGARIKSYQTKSEQLQANIGWCYSANSAIVEPASAVKLQLFRKKSDGDREEITDHQILDLLGDPNAAFSGEQLRQLHETYLNFNGEGYIWMLRGGQPFIPAKGKLPDALQIMPAHQVDFKLSRDGVYSNSRILWNNTEVPFWSVIRDMNPDPLNPYKGRSIIRAAAAAVDIDWQMRQWNQNLIANGARTSLVFTTSSPDGQAMDDIAYERWKAQFADEHTGALNAGKPILIENGDVKQTMLTPQDLDFLGSRKFSMEEIYMLWRVSTGVVGAVANVNRSNLDAGFYIHTVINIVPRMRRFVRQLNQTFVNVFDPTLELDYENPVPEDEATNLAYAKAAAGNLPWLTPDEVRDLYGEKPLPDDLGQQLYFPARTATLDEIANQDEPAANVTGAEATQDGGDPQNEPDQDKNKALAGVKKKA